MSYNDQKILEGYLFWDHLGDAIIAAFGLIHHGHPLLSGTRMVDLVSMQPNIRIDLFMVASDQRREKAAFGIHRPTFARPGAAPAPGSAASAPLPSGGGGWSRSGGAIRYLKPGIYLSNCGRAREQEGA